MAKHGTKPKRKKPYVPKGVNPNAAFNVVRDNWRATFKGTQENAETSALRARFAANVGAEQQDTLSREFNTAFVALLTGGGDMNDWSEVTGVLNTALVLCERGFGEEYTAAMIEAQDQVFAAKLHYDATGEWVFTDEARAAINEGLDVHTAQLEHTKQADILSAYAEVARRIDQQQVYKAAA